MSISKFNEDNVGEENQTLQQESFHNSNIIYGKYIVDLTWNEQDLPQHEMTCMNSTFNIKYCSLSTPLNWLMLSQ
jgi:hypothetical protein